MLSCNTFCGISGWLFLMSSLVIKYTPLLSILDRYDRSKEAFQPAGIYGRNIPFKILLLQLTESLLDLLDWM